MKYKFASVMALTLSNLLLSLTAITYQDAGFIKVDQEEPRDAIVCKRNGLDRKQSQPRFFSVDYLWFRDEYSVYGISNRKPNSWGNTGTVYWGV